jgi:hypothetical protein
MKMCFKCGIEKEMGSFYIHKDMKDGRLNKCIDCAKKDTKSRVDILGLNPEFIESEKARGREKYHRLNYRGKYNPTYENKKKAIDRYIKKYPEKIKCKNRCKLKAEKGNNLHHWNYNLDYAESVIELSIKDHNKVHRFIKYCNETFMYKDLNGLLLNTKEKHIEYMNKVLLNF